METEQFTVNKNFIDREYESQRLKEISDWDEAVIIMAYGRRRVGKTELLEQNFRNRNVLKFEGLEKKDQKIQMQHVMQQLGGYLKDKVIANMQIDSWKEVFKNIAFYTSKGTWTIYFEEVQWLADYKDDFASELKYVWDNYFRRNEKLILILCGSSPSFMINSILHSKALYNRSQHELNVRPFNLIQTKAFLKKRSDKEVLDAFLSVGGIPEYLKYLNKESSVYLALCRNSFRKDGFFLHEYKRIFISSLANNKFYKQIIEFLSKKPFAIRNELIKHLKIPPGGGLTAVLDDLLLCGFIQKYTPYNLKQDSLLARYCIADEYLQFYYKFIKPEQTEIEDGSFDSNPTKAISMETYYKWLGFAFERMCRKFHYVIAEMLGFSAIKYRSGAFFNRATNKEDKGYQIDLIFDRNDQVFTICEIRYHQKKIGISVIEDFERKMELFPNPKGRTIQRVLICNEGAEESLINHYYFDVILTKEDFFDPRNWK